MSVVFLDIYNKLKYLAQPDFEPTNSDIADILAYTCFIPETCWLSTKQAPAKKGQVDDRRQPDSDFYCSYCASRDNRQALSTKKDAFLPKIHLSQHTCREISSILTPFPLHLNN